MCVCVCRGVCIRVYVHISQLKIYYSITFFENYSNLPTIIYNNTQVLQSF